MAAGMKLCAIKLPIERLCHRAQKPQMPVQPTWEKVCCSTVQCQSLRPRKVSVLLQYCRYMSSADLQDMGWHGIGCMWCAKKAAGDRLALQKHNRNSTQTIYLQIFTSPVPLEYSVDDINCIGIRAMSTTHIDSTQQHVLFKFINVNDSSSATPAWGQLA